MERRTRTILLAVGLLFAIVSLASEAGQWRLPGDNSGYAPSQPIAFSHRLHAGELEMDCLYCHGGAEKSRHAGIPSADLCMNCHRFVHAPLVDVRAEEKAAEKEKRKANEVWSPEIRKLYDALGLDDKGVRDLSREPKPIEWVQIHRLPDFAYFDHRPHVAAGVACARCHGPVESMERVRQESSLSMGWCLDCHRTGHTDAAGLTKKGTQDCAACHY